MLRLFLAISSILISSCAFAEEVASRQEFNCSHAVKIGSPEYKKLGRRIFLESSNPILKCPFYLSMLEAYEDYLNNGTGPDKSKKLVKIVNYYLHEILKGNLVLGNYERLMEIQKQYLIFEEDDINYIHAKYLYYKTLRDIAVRDVSLDELVNARKISYLKDYSMYEHYFYLLDISRQDVLDKESLYWRRKLGIAECKLSEKKVSNDCKSKMLNTFLEKESQIDVSVWQENIVCKFIFFYANKIYVSKICSL